ncbi:MAG: twin transmembrane helix small protein [Pseudomonadota bacterium]
MFMRIFVIAVLIVIVVALGSGLYFLVTDKGHSDRTVKALSWRIGLSVGLFVLLMGLYATGVIQPHGLMPGKPAQVQQQ